MQMVSLWYLPLLTNSVLVRADVFTRHLPMNRWAAALLSAACGFAVHETFSAFFQKRGAVCLQFWCSDLRDLKYRVIFGYGPLGIKKLTVLEAGDGDLTEMSQHLPSDAVAFCFMQVGCLQTHRLSHACVDSSVGFDTGRDVSDPCRGNRWPRRLLPSSSGLPRLQGSFTNPKLPCTGVSS